ncbi:DUF2283 domain-containing protein [Pendulispora brunnea]|uniref:DUF2283 domain-containing protein n=1 Tax=Pendulispora brunnea TaxID=2905690 RepID=A0ABZ2KMI7_9BACT
MAIGRFDFKVTGPTTAYLRLPTYPDTAVGASARTVTLPDLMGAYQGPYVVFDFDKDGVLIGIEIVGDDVEAEQDRPGEVPADGIQRRPNRSRA